MGIRATGAQTGLSAIEWQLIEIVEKRAQRVEVLLRGRIVLVVVTDGATYGEAHEGRAVSLGALPRNVDPQLLGNRAAFVAAHTQPDIPAGYQGSRFLAGRRSPAICSFAN